MVFSKTLYSGITTSGKEAFGNYKQKLNAGDYIQNKTSSATYCNANICNKKIPVLSNSDLILLKRAYLLSKQGNANKNNLTNGLVTTIDLNEQNVIENKSGTTPTTLDLTVNPYLEYVIDASGNLFGNTICGINNIENFRIPN